MAGNYSGFSLRASEAPPAILGPSGAATRLPGPKNLFFLKLALFISELLLELPGAPGVSLELSWIPSSLQGCPRLPQARGNLSRLNARIPPPHNAPPGDPQAGLEISKPFLLRMAGNTPLPPGSPQAALVLLKPSS